MVAILACGLLGGLAMGATDAAAYRELLNHGAELDGGEEWLIGVEGKPAELEGACGIAVSPVSGGVYVSDYYHRAIRIYSPEGLALGSISLPGVAPPTEINTLNAVCGVAVDASETLYVNELHQAVLQMPGEGVVDPGQATGVAVDGSGNVYVNDRTHIAVYLAPVEPGEAAAEKIAVGSLLDGYGIAVDPAGATVYVADAADNTVKGYATGVGATDPVVTADHDFVSLVDASLAVDPTNGHVLVVDDLEQGFENPLAAVYELDADGEFLDRLTGRKVGERVHPLEGPIFGEPSGIGVDPISGDLYVTTGNGWPSNVVKYGQFKPFAPLATSLPGESLPAPPRTSATAHSDVGGEAGRTRNPSASASEIVQRRGVRVRFDGELTPRALPRHGMAPVGIAVDAEIGATGATAPPQLRKIAIAINRNGRFDTKGLPVCRLHDIQPSTTANALAACRHSLVGEGHFSANVKLPEQSPFPSVGKVLAFNGRLHGKPAILAHIYGTQPAPTSTVLPFLINDSRGTYGTVLEASLPRATGDWGYVTGLKMNLRRHFAYRGKGRSYLSAGCPAPAGFPSVAFPLARTSFDFAGGLTLVSILNRSCRAKG
jgi:DNA-binding beta-propeller fold protein YncE